MLPSPPPLRKFQCLTRCWAVRPRLPGAGAGGHRGRGLRGPGGVGGCARLPPASWGPPSTRVLSEGHLCPQEAVPTAVLPVVTSRAGPRGGWQAALRAGGRRPSGAPTVDSGNLRVPWAGADPGAAQPSPAPTRILQERVQDTGAEQPAHPVGAPRTPRGRRDRALRTPGLRWEGRPGKGRCLGVAGLGGAGRSRKPHAAGPAGRLLWPRGKLKSRIWFSGLLFCFVVFC